LAYQYGPGTKKDNAEAVKWYRKSAESGYPDAEADLGAMYEKGLGVQQDDSEAMKWYQKSLADGNKNAQAKIDHLKQRMGE
ncbi:MAG TPA: sel1 repeat family protein, partial [bacterium]